MERWIQVLREVRANNSHLNHIFYFVENAKMSIYIINEINDLLLSPIHTYRERGATLKGVNAYSEIYPGN